MQRLGRFPRLVQELECLVQREHARGIARGAPRISKRPRQVACLHEMVREVLRVIVRARPGRLAFADGRAMRLLQCLADALVQPPAADGVQLLVQHLANLVVREREVVVAARGGCARPTAVGADELRRRRLVQRVEQRVLARRRHRGEFPERKDLAQRRRRSQCVHGRLRKPVEPPSDRLLHALRNGQLVRFLAAPAFAVAIDLTLLDQRLDDLLDEEGIAFGLAVERLREIIRHVRDAEQRRQQMTGIGAGQSRQRDPRAETLAVPFHQRSRQRMRAVEFDLAIGDEEEHAVVSQVAQQVMQQRQRALVRPVDVVDEHHEATLGGEMLQKPRRVVEEAHPLLAGRQRGIGGERAQLGFDLGRELGDFRRRRAKGAAQLFGALPPRPLAKRLDERQVGRRRLVLIASAAQQRRAALLGMGDEILREARLAHAGFPGQQHELPARLLRLGPVLAQLRRLAGAPDQLPTHQLRERCGIPRRDIFHAQRRKGRRQVGGDELVDVFRRGNAAQLVRAQVAQRRPRRQRLPDEVRGGRRQQRLPAVAGGHHALDARQRERGIVFATARLHGAGVQPHAHAYGPDVAPALLVQRVLRGKRRAQRVAGILERRAKAVTQDLEHVAASRADRVLQQCVVAPERRLHRFGMLLHEACRPLDVREEKGDNAAGQGVHGRSSLPLLSSVRHRRGAVTWPLYNARPLLPAPPVEHPMSFAKRLNSLTPETLRGLNRGIEKESLRVQPDGKLATTPHPERLGSALTHPRITTDFSESQLELITGVHAGRAKLRRRADADPPGRLPRHRRRAALVREHALRSAHRQLHPARPLRHVQRGSRQARLPHRTVATATAGACRPSPASTTTSRCRDRSPTTTYFALIRNFRRHSLAAALPLRRLARCLREFRRRPSARTANVE